MRRRIAIVLGLVMAATAREGPPAAWQAAPSQPAASQPARGPALAFASDAGILLSPIVPAQAAIFEQVMQKVREALEKSADPVRRKQAAGWRVYKATDPFQGHTLYISVMDPAVKGAEYNVFDFLRETMGDAEARALFEQFRAAHGAPQHVVSMSPFLSMSAAKYAAGSRQ